MIMKLYKIRRKSDGLFLSPYSIPEFHKDGKMFTLKELLEYFRGYNMISERERSLTILIRFKDCEVIELELKETKKKVNPGQLHFEKFIFEEL